MQKIENNWKNTSFEMIKYGKGSDENKTYVLKGVEDIRTLLDDTILVLQGL